MMLRQTCTAVSVGSLADINYIYDHEVKKLFQDDESIIITTMLYKYVGVSFKIFLKFLLHVGKPEMYAGD